MNPGILHLKGNVYGHAYDSHLHWQATGEFARRLALQKLSHPRDVLDLKINDEHRQGNWILGFGYDETDWTESPQLKYLDQKFPSQLLSLVRIDGHSTWVNSHTLKACGITNEQGDRIIPDPVGGTIVCDESGKPTGVLVDTAKGLIDKHIPPKSKADVRRDLLSAQKMLLDSGISHIRDMSCDPMQWEVMQELENENLLQLHVEQNFDVENPHDYKRALKLALDARPTASAKRKIGAVKVYCDGSLGSDSAWISRPYPNGSYGLQLMDKKLLTEILTGCWGNGFPVAIHTLGDKAVEFVVDHAIELKSKGITGKLHLEHVELASPETIRKMKQLDVTCHLQPSHFLSDRKWLTEKLGALMSYAFPWAELEKNEIPFYFGSDSPIEPLGIDRTEQALKESKGIIAPLKGNWLERHQLPFQASSL